MFDLQPVSLTYTTIPSIPSPMENKSLIERASAKQLTCNCLDGQKTYINHKNITLMVLNMKGRLRATVTQNVFNHKKVMSLTLSTVKFPLWWFSLLMDIIMWMLHVPNISRQICSIQWVMKVNAHTLCYNLQQKIFEMKLQEKTRNRQSFRITLSSMFHFVQQKNESLQNITT